MGRPRQISDAEILAAARSVFIEQGPQASTSTIAEALGVSQPALFRRFGSKEELMLAALAPPQRPDWVRFVEQGPDSRPLREQLSEIAERATRFLSEMTPCFTALRASGMDPTTLMGRYAEGPPPLLAYRALVGWFERASQAGLVRPSLSADVAANVFLGALQLPAFLSHMSMSHRPAPMRPPALDQVVDLVARGLEEETV